MKPKKDLKHRRDHVAFEFPGSMPTDEPVNICTLHLGLLWGQSSSIWLLQHVPVMIFVFMFGACVGSFLNVVIYRLPARMSVISPPSRCPTCGARLKFFRENLPILGWFFVRGKCRYCGVRISAQYMIVELLLACTLLGLYILLFIPHPSTPWWGTVGGAWWHYNSIVRAWPAFIAFAFLISGLVAMTVIDARTFEIPLPIPTFITVTAFIVYPLQAILPLRSPPAQTWPIPGVTWMWFMIAVGGMCGILLSIVLLRMGVFKYSFTDYEKYVKDDEPLAEYPHARREMLVELKFLLPCMVGLITGGLLGLILPQTAPPVFIQALGATLLGYLVGGGLIWAIRILGTFAFGREAMGLGDVHLLGAVGAVLGWFDPILIFFLAPFFGLLWALLSMGLGTVFKMVRRQVPYGPHLAVATIVLLLCRPGIERLWKAYWSTVPMPQRSLVQNAPKSSTPSPKPNLPTTPPTGNPQTP